MIEACPRPKWNSSLPLNEPAAITNGPVGAGLGEPVCGGRRDSGTVVAKGAANEATGRASAEIGAGSTRDERRKIGEPRYQPTGSATASAAATSALVRPGCR